MSKVLKILFTLLVFIIPTTIESSSNDNYWHFYKIGEYYKDMYNVLSSKGYIKGKYSIDTLPISSPVPLNTIDITSDYGYRIHPIFRVKLFHHGIDFGLKLMTPIVATANGVVVGVKYSRHGYGNRIVIQHGKSFSTMYAHLSRIRVKEGEIVHRNDTIGLSGNTGLSTGPHLHYEIRYHNKSIDPMFFTYTKSTERNRKHYITYLKTI